MLGGRNNISSTAGIQSYGSNVGVGGAGAAGGGGGRRHLNHAAGVAAAAASVVTPMMAPNANTFSPHNLYNPQHVNNTTNEMYRTGGTTTMSASEPFPATPYTPVANLFLSPMVRNTMITQHNYQPPKRLVTHVTSSKFAEYTPIYNIEAEAHYSTLVPKVSTQVYQTSSRFSGYDILLRRIVNVTINAEECKAITDMLRQHRHPNLVTLSNIIVTDEFVMGSNDIIMEYRFINGARSLYESFLTETTRATEGQLWSMTCQLVGLLRSFHEMLVPVRGLHISKIIFVEATGRFYFTGLGLKELLEPKAFSTMTQRLMKDDIQALGLIIFQLAARSRHVTPENFNSKQPMAGFSQSFWELIKTLLEGNSDLAQLCHALGERMSMEVGHQEGYCDYVLRQGMKEMHNGRIMRLLIKLNFVMEYINDVQDYHTDNQRLAMRLFNQFVFYQVDEHNRVHLDWGHAYHCLNKLDCGSEETIQLIGNENNSTVMVVSYADMRNILENLFQQLQQMAQAGNDVENQVYQLASPGML